MPPNMRAAVLERLAHHEIDEALVWTVRSWGAKAIDVLRDVARGRVPAGRYERANAVYLLGLIKPAKVMDDLTHVARTVPSGPVRLSAIAAFGRVGDADARKVLLTIASTDAAPWPERSTALTWLSEIGEAADLAVLERITPAAGDLALERRLADTVSAVRLRIGRPVVVATPPQDASEPAPGKPKPKPKPKRKTSEAKNPKK